MKVHGLRIWVIDTNIKKYIPQIFVKLVHLQKAAWSVFLLTSCRAGSLVLPYDTFGQNLPHPNFSALDDARVILVGLSNQANMS